MMNKKFGFYVKYGTTGKIMSGLFFLGELSAVLTIGLPSVLFYHYVHPIAGFLFAPVVIISLLITYGLEEVPSVIKDKDISNDC